MNIGKAKLLKLLSLLISSLFIATVSAAVYNYMYITGKGGIATGTGLSWDYGADYPAATIDGNTVSDVNMTTNEGNPRNVTDCLHIVNLDGVAHTFSIEITSSPSSTANKNNFTEFNLVLFNSTSGGTEQAVLDVKTQGSIATGLSIPALATWRVLFELVPISTPTSGAAVEFEVTLIYESSA